ncbi:hypothetical protein ACRALDRAFT_208417 [Sodiomyces alcalophilus JCM 7366]|uniref:uncharacterized protein n=1 Tax=Sodiomyces alcalophilus JCM 7366 TaxID=591952 RepID=UPI0039B6025B
MAAADGTEEDDLEEKRQFELWNTSSGGPSMGLPEGPWACLKDSESLWGTREDHGGR